MIIKELDYKKYKGKKYQAEILSDWLENPVAYGAFEGDKLIGMVVVPGWWCSKLKPLTLR